MKQLYAQFRSHLLAGLAFAIPLVVTGWVLVLVYRAIEGISRPIVRAILRETIDPPGGVVSIIGFLVIIGIISGIGFMARNVIGSRLLRLIDDLVLRVPVVAFIYNGLKQIIDSIKAVGTKREFKRVAYVEYPSPGCRLIGFVTSEFFDPGLKQAMTCIFVPTSPNPMTGFVIVVEDDKVTDSVLTLEQASKIIFSAGLVSPEELTNATAKSS